MKIDARRMTFSIILSLILSGMYWVGSSISQKYHTAMTLLPGGEVLWWQCLAVCVFLTVFFYCFFGFLQGGQEQKKAAAKRKSGKAVKVLWPLFFILLFCSWLPVLAAAYPGFYNYDAAGQLPQAMYDTVPYNSHHSLLHTLIMGKIITWGYGLFGENLTKGILCHSLFQMAACSLVFTLLARKIVLVTDRILFLPFTFLYYALSPVIAMFTMSTTKDVLCCLFLLLSAVGFFDLYRDETGFFQTKSKPALLVLGMIVMGLLRKNGVYGLILLFFLVLLADRSQKVKKLFLLGSAIVLCVLCNQLLVWGLRAEKGGAAEAFSVPLQQIARVYEEKGREGFTKEEWELVEDVASEEVLKRYEPVLADPIKNSIYFSEVEKKPLSYGKLWFSLGCRYPGIYAKAFLENTYQAFYPWTTVTDSVRPPQIYYFDMTMRGGTERYSKNEKLLAFYRGIAENCSYQNFPVIRLFFSTGAMLWMAVTVLFYGLYRKRSAVIWPMLLILAYCATSMLGPVALVRYYLILFYAMPLCVLLLTCEDWNREKKE